MGDRFDLAVVGAGPCGIAVGAAARAGNVDCVLFDKGCVTQSLVGYPYYMTFFSTAEKLEIAGVPFTIAEQKPTRREALAYYHRVVQEWDLDVRQYEEVLAVEGAAGDFLIRTRRVDGMEKDYRAGAVAVATGSFFEPNFLGVPGEDLPKVHHYYKEPYPYFDQDVLVVGAGNSAVETALELFRAGVRVSMVHFLDTIDRGVKPWVVPDITNRLDRGEIPVHWRSRVAEVKQGSVMIRDEDSGEMTEIDNDFVVAMTGWRSDPHILRDLGVTIDGDTGIPTYDPTTMETDVPGVYIAGVLAAGNNANKIFIENGKHHGGLIVASVTSATT
jgi:thioredoxin reductase (NADPH)